MERCRHKDCIDAATFEMRTVLSGIHLFIDNPKSSDSIFISNRDGGRGRDQNSRETERECVCKRQRIAEKGR